MKKLCAWFLMVDGVVLLLSLILVSKKVDIAVGMGCLVRLVVMDSWEVGVGAVVVCFVTSLGVEEEALTVLAVL
jgi:hypothetical protein